jgi:hypothetical protein
MDEGYEVSGRPYSTDFRLGRLMRHSGHTDVYHLAAELDISPRQMSRYLAGEEIQTHHLMKLSVELNVPGNWIQEEANGGLSDREIADEAMKIAKGLSPTLGEISDSFKR